MTDAGIAYHGEKGEAIANAIAQDKSMSEDNVVGSFIETKPSQVKGVMIDPLLSTTTTILIKHTGVSLTKSPS